MKKLLLAAMAGALLTACGSSDDSPQPPKPNPEKDYATLIIGKWHLLKMEITYSKTGEFEVKDYTKHPEYEACRKNSYIEFTKEGMLIDASKTIFDGKCVVDADPPVNYKLEGDKYTSDEENEILKLTDKELIVEVENNDIDGDGKPEKQKAYFIRVK
ncbi:lipocalin family protein [Ornithobacterium rhinotracheale]|uniref:lipocalin family protein n=1 Tax=Ornithobacterium rhinotracheale TaxID=28251 RepID=UPI001FF1B992|nr:lipocalin family protein [Ornithobacterium rhinotracheale]MCK0205679.1 hypothetical protein [Ornithobacterium rhinotracheale]